MKTLKLLFAISILVLTTNCEKTFEGDFDSIYVYKVKNDYSDKVPVELSEDKSKITAYPGPNEVDKPIALAVGYYLMGSFGSNSGYLSLTISEYNQYEVPPGPDSLYNMLIDKDPFVSFFYRDNDEGFQDESVPPYGIDTAKINDLIRKEALSNHFTRIK